MRFTRRGFLAQAAIAAPLLRGQSEQRPNILWISIEDSSPFLGCWGDRKAITPNIDRLAKEGVRYTNTFSVAGVCAPSRSAIITGMYPSSLGSQHMRTAATLPPHVKCFPEYLRQAGYYCTNNVKTDYNLVPQPSVWDESSRQAHWKNRPAGKPFFAVFNFETTHESQVRNTPEGFQKVTARLKASERQDPARQEPPPYYPDTPVVRRQLANFYELVTAVDYQVGDILKEIDEAGLAEDTIVFFWGDHGIGLPRAKRWLYDSGTRSPLVIRIPAKHRKASQGAPGSTDDQLVSFLDLGPTVLNLCGVTLPSHFHGRAFLGSNLSPERKYIYGTRDRMDERYDLIRSVRDKRWRYIRNYEAYKTYYQHIAYCELSPVMQEIRRVHSEGKLPAAAAQFMADHKPVEELYDLQSDPHEVRNLAGVPEHRNVLERMRAAHNDWMLQTLDTGLIPEPEMAARGSTLGSRWAVLQQPGSVELLGRLKQAVASVEKGDEHALVKCLRDSDAAVRYWGATGIGNLKKASQGALQKLGAALKDDSPVVRIAAARGVLRHQKQEDDALAVLTQELKHPEASVRIHATMQVGESPVARKRCRTAIEALAQDPNEYVKRLVQSALAD